MTVEVAPAAELIDKVNALKSLTTIYKLLEQGSYPYKEAHAVPHSLAFIQSLHKTLKDECFAHEDCDKVPELLDLKEREQELAKGSDEQA